MSESPLKPRGTTLKAYSLGSQLKDLTDLSAQQDLQKLKAPGYFPKTSQRRRQQKTALTCCTKKGTQRLP